MVPFLSTYLPIKFNMTNQVSASYTVPPYKPLYHLYISTKKRLNPTFVGLYESRYKVGQTLTFRFIRSAKNYGLRNENWPLFQL